MDLRTFIGERIQYRLERVAGVAAVETWGGLEREIRVEVDPDRLRAFGLSLDEVMESLREANVTLPAGDIDEGMYQVTLRAPGLFLDLGNIERTVIAMRQGAPIYLEQVATGAGAAGPVGEPDR